MPKKPDTDKYFSPREITASLNNAVIFSSRPTEPGPIADPRARVLREYAEALIAPAQEHLEEGLLTPQELVFVLAAAGLYAQLAWAQTTDKVPARRIAQSVIQDEDNA